MLRRPVCKESVYRICTDLHAADFIRRTRSGTGSKQWVLQDKTQPIRYVKTVEAIASVVAILRERGPLPIAEIRKVLARSETRAQEIINTLRDEGRIYVARVQQSVDRRGRPGQLVRVWALVEAR